MNLHGTSHVLAAALASSQVERVLVVSSSGVYGTPADGALQPQRETDPLDLTNLYAITKHSAELLAARFAVLSGKPMAAVRLPAIYGPMERSLASRRHTSAPGLLMAALRAGRPVRVAGPAVARDWTYAADVAAGVWALLTAPGWRYPVYNLSCGQAAPFAEVVQAFVDSGWGRNGWTRSTRPTSRCARNRRAHRWTLAGSRRTQTSGQRTRSTMGLKTGSPNWWMDDAQKVP